MKFRMLLSALLLAAGVLFFAGCDKKAETKAESKTDKNADTPTEVVNKYAAAMRKMDFAAAARLCYGRQKEEIEDIGKQIANIKAAADNGNENARRLYEQRAKPGFAKFKIEIKSEKIEGDFAILDFVMHNPDDTVKEEKGYLKKINGEWKLISEKDYKPAKK